MQLTEAEFQSRLEKIKAENAAIEYRRKLRQERWKRYPKLKLPSTSKLVMIVSAVLCIQILVFCERMIETTGDTNALYAMVGALVAFVPVVLGYFSKSAKENTQGGVVFETAMAALGEPPEDEPKG